MAMNLYQDPFFCVPRTSHATRQDNVDLPVLYQDSTAVFAFFGCDRDSVSALLPPGRLAPALTWRSRAIVGLALFEYRTTSIGRYNEVGLAVPVAWKKGPVPACPAIDLLRNAYVRRVGYYIVDLPVTTETACSAGRELWGYPKFVTPIEFALHKKQLHCRLHDPGKKEAIMTLAGKPGPGLPCPALDLVTFECVGDQDRRTIIHTRGGGRVHGPGSVRLHLGASAHPMAKRLRRLALDGARPLAIWVCTRFQSRLNAGAPLDLPPT
jgi:hypothetical protein